MTYKTHEEVNAHHESRRETLKVSLTESPSRKKLRGVNRVKESDEMKIVY